MTTRKRNTAATPPEADPGRPIRHITESHGEYVDRLQAYTARRDAALRAQGDA